LGLLTPRLAQPDPAAETSVVVADQGRCSLPRLSHCHQLGQRLSRHSVFPAVRDGTDQVHLVLDTIQSILVVVWLLQSSRL